MNSFLIFSFLKFLPAPARVPLPDPFPQPEPQVELLPDGPEPEIIEKLLTEEALIDGISFPIQEFDESVLQHWVNQSTTGIWSGLLPHIRIDIFIFGYKYNPKFDSGETTITLGSGRRENNYILGLNTYDNPLWFRENFVQDFCLSVGDKVTLLYEETRLRFWIDYDQGYSPTLRPEAAEYLLDPEDYLFNWDLIKFVHPIDTKHGLVLPSFMFEGRIPHWWWAAPLGETGHGLTIGVRDLDTNTNYEISFKDAGDGHFILFWGTDFVERRKFRATNWIGFYFDKNSGLLGISLLRR